MIRARLFYVRHIFAVAVLSAVLSACSPDKFIPEHRYLLDRVDVRSDDEGLDASLLSQYVRQKGNSRWFSFFKIPLGTYALAGRDSTKWINRTLKKIGEEPVLYDTLQARQSCEDLRLAMQNMGYMKARVDFDAKARGRKVRVVYRLHPGTPFIIDSLGYDIRDSVVARVLKGHLHFGDSAALRPLQFTVSALEQERRRITRILADSGFYRFNKDFIYYTADSVRGSSHIGVTLHLSEYRSGAGDSPMPHPRYIVHSVRVSPGDSTGLHLRRSIIGDNVALREGTWFSATDLQKTYNNFARLGAVRYTNINFRELETIDSIVVGKTIGYRRSANRYLDAEIQLSHNKPNTFSFQPEGTNTAGDLGAAAVLSYQNRNLFRGSELFSVELRAAFEAITGLEGYENHDFEEYGVRARLQFPRFVYPFVSHAFRRRSSAVSEASVSWDLQNRPEFHRRVFSAAWKYHWSNPARHTNYTLDVLDLSYVYMPWISATFKHDYLDNVSTRNAILRYNYEDLFIMRMGLGVSYSNGDHAVRAHIETAGNLLGVMNGIFKFNKNAQGRNVLFNIAYAQYAKFDFDYTRLIRFDARNTLVLHTDWGIAWPYGNSNVLPFEKRYISGGANSVRGWSVRELGPGKFRGKDGRIDFINQTGDVKLDLNAEYRTHLFWKFDGAVFLDAGNIWTLRSYSEQPGGQFAFRSFLRQLAVAYGLGLRLNFDYFILRFDAGMKAVNPSYESAREHYAVLHPDLKRDFTFHFAVGMPF